MIGDWYSINLKVIFKFKLKLNNNLNYKLIVLMEKDINYDNMIKCVAISDTHNKTDNYQVPSGDILFHSGDFTLRGTTK